MLIYIDVETIPSQRPDARDLVRQHVKPPGTYRKPESIAAWHATEGPGAVEEAWRKQSLDGGTMGEICSIAMLTDDDRWFVHCRRPGESEAELLHMAFATVEAWTQADARAMLPGRSETFPVDDHHLVAHNAAFDLGFLWRRSVVNDVPRPAWLPGPMARVGRDFTCTMQLWAGYGKTVSLDNLCLALGVPSPKNGALDGSMVFDAWLDHRSAVIAEYNLRDVYAVREVYHRMLGLPRAAA